MLIDKLLYITYKSDEITYNKKELSLNNSFYPSYQELYDFLKDTILKEEDQSQIRLGYRYKTKTEGPIIELFISIKDIEAVTNNIKMVRINKKLKQIAIIEVELVQDALIRNTLLPFNSKRDTLLNGSIFSIEDYIEVLNSSKPQLRSKKKEFIKIAGDLTLLHKNNLYRPIETEKLRAKNIYFEDYEAIYLHNWSQE